jgi:glycosyltransferase involved in cell wall biosynthesis
VKIAITVDPEIPVPPLLYGGIERIVDMLVQGLVDRGHEITLFAHPNSKVPCRLVAYSGRKSQNTIDFIRNTFTVSRAVLAGNYDLIHSFGRLGYMMPLLPTSLPKLMSYQREPSLIQIKKALRYAKKDTLTFTGCSEYIASQIRPLAPSYAIPNGVPLKTYEFKSHVQATAPLVFLGRVEEIKGTHIAIEVAKKSGHPLIIAGNIPEDKQDYFETRIRPHIDDRQITYIGPVNDFQKNELLGKALAFLMPITWNEPFGIVMAEALACGTPILAFPKGATPEVVQAGVNGYLCHSVEEMIQAVLQVSALRRADCRRIYEERFSDEAIVTQYELLYRQIT